jgi:hypothetical protein
MSDTQALLNRATRVVAWAFYALAIVYASRNHYAAATYCSVQGCFLLLTLPRAVPPSEGG